MFAEGAGAILIVAASITDIRTRRIPNVLTMSMLIVGLGYHALQDGFEGMSYAGLGILCGLLPTLLLYVMRALGAGDVKLFAALGAWMGSAFTWQTLMLSIMIGGLVACGLLLFRYRSLGARLISVLQQFIGTRSIVALRPLIAQPATFPFMIAVLPAVLLVYMQGY